MLRLEQRKTKKTKINFLKRIVAARVKLLKSAPLLKSCWKVPQGAFNSFSIDQGAVRCPFRAAGFSTFSCAISIVWNMTLTTYHEFRMWNSCDREIQISCENMEKPPALGRAGDRAFILLASYWKLLKNLSTTCQQRRSFPQFHNCCYYSL